MILFAATALQVATAALPDIFDELPGQYAGTSREMAESGSWLVPTLGGVPRLQKPPLVYWITAASLSLFGRNEFAARLPTALAMAGIMLVTFAMGARLYGRDRGAAAAAVLGTSLGAALLGKLIMPEPFLALWMALSLLAVVRCVEDPERRRLWALLAWLAAALAALSKGLHGLLLTAVIVALVAAFHPASRRPLAALIRPHGPALFLALVLPWPLYIESQFPGYLRDNFFNEQLGHLIDTHFPRDSEPTPLSLLWAQHLLWWFPWALFVPAALMSRGGGRTHPLAGLPAAWLLVVAVSASLSGQRQDYHTMSVWPAFALLLSRAWDGREDRRGVKLAQFFPLAALSTLALLGLAVYALGGIEPPSGGGMSAPFGSRNSALGALSGIAWSEWLRLRGLLPLAAGSLLVGSIGGLALAWKRETRGWSWTPVAAGMLVVQLAALSGLQVFAPYFGLKTIAETLNRESARRAIVVYDGPSHQSSSLCFYADLLVRWLDRAESEFAARSRGVGRDRFVTVSEVVAKWRSGEPIFLIIEEGRLDLWRQTLGGDPGPIIARSGTRILLYNGVRG